MFLSVITTQFDIADLFEKVINLELVTGTYCNNADAHIELTCEMIRHVDSFNYISQKCQDLLLQLFLVAITDVDDTFSVVKINLFADLGLISENDTLSVRVRGFDHSCMMIRVIFALFLEMKCAIHPHLVQSPSEEQKDAKEGFKTNLPHK